MTHQTLGEYGGLGDGLHTLFLYANDVTSGVFIVMFLFSLYIIVMLGIYFSTKHSTGQGDFPQAMAVSGFLLVVVAGLLRLAGEGIVSITTFTTCMVVFLIGLVIIFFSNKN
jgi:hypothetical protein